MLFVPFFLLQKSVLPFGIETQVEFEQKDQELFASLNRYRWKYKSLPKLAKIILYCDEDRKTTGDSGGSLLILLSKSINGLKIVTPEKITGSLFCQDQ